MTQAIDAPVTTRHPLAPLTAAVPRLATCVTYDRSERLTQWVTVSLGAGSVVQVDDVAGAQPPILMDEWVADALAVKADPRWQEAMRRRGITDVELVQVDPWPASHFDLPVDRTGRRLGRAVSYVR